VSTIVKWSRVRVTLALRDPAARKCQIPSQHFLLHFVDVADDDRESFEESPAGTESWPPATV